jgi:hypothetical protein
MYEYTASLLVIVDRVKGGGRAPPPPSPGWADFTIMMECLVIWNCNMQYPRCLQRGLPLNAIRNHRGRGKVTQNDSARVKTMDQITTKTPNPKVHLYWCLLEFIDWRYSQSCWYFRHLLSAPPTFSMVRPPPPLPA